VAPPTPGSRAPSAARATPARVALVGARGYTGREVLTLLAAHAGVEIALVTSGKDAGQKVFPDGPPPARADLADLTYAAPSPEEAASLRLDAYLLALPNGTSEPWVSAIHATRPDAVIVDLSADHRFDDAWVYGQPERHRARLRGATRIANPGCYATAMQLALAPLVPLLAPGAPPSVFGVSGYSGAGTTPSPKNDPEVLEDNLLPYALTGHVHEREVSRQLGTKVFFAPHVAPFFRGITCTSSVAFAASHTREALAARYAEAYADEPLALWSASPEPPLVRDIMNRHEVAIGGLTVSDDGLHAVVVSTIDNLLGGAATQAVRNLNLALGFPERQGIDAPSR
jgi:N-acetyl-gamma-glutamyl-phosphate reductase